MEVSQAQPNKRVEVFPELISGLFDALNGPGGESAGACLRDLLPYNVRLLREEELPLGTLKYTFYVSLMPRASELNATNT